MMTVRCCSCGHQWQLPDPDWSAVATGPSHCPKCGTLVDTVTDHRGIEEMLATATFDSSLSGGQSGMATGRPGAIAGYEIQGELGRGGMGVVYRAFSTKLGRTVALKTLQRIDPTALQRFKQEFRVLADVTHPNLVTRYELVSDGTTWFFSMELVEGVDLLRYVRRPLSSEEEAADADDSPPWLSPWRLIRIRRALAQLIWAVAALHRAGVLHRDIKPSNLMVTPDERLVLLDFGLAAELAAGAALLSSTNRVVGTAPYMSPEQAASQPVTQASDWYAVGTVLYEALTDGLPFTGRPLEILWAKQRREPPPPSAVIPNVPEDLDRLCAALLHTDPHRRPQVDEILAQLNLPATSAVSGGAVSVSPAEPAALIGRDRHLGFLDQCYQEMEANQGTLVFVHGQSGMGKTALVHEFLSDVRRRHDAVILEGRCYEQESVPFKALDSQIDALCDYLRKLPRTEADSLMPRDIQALLRVFPVMGRIEAAYDARRRMLGDVGQEELRRRAVAALREMLTRIGDRHPLVIFIDDLQWGDVDSARMLCDLFRPPDAPLAMFLGAYRAEDADTSPFLRTFRELEQRSLQRLNLRELAVEPLDAADGKQLVLRLLSRDDGAALEQAEKFARESRGSPFFLRELANYLQSSAAAEAHPHIDLEAILRVRLERLPEPARRLLETIAVAGRPTGQPTILQAAQLEAEGPALLAGLKAEHLIRVTTSDQESRLETYHDRIREAALRRMLPEERQERHARMAAIIRAALQTPVEALQRRDPAGRYGGDAGDGEALPPEEWQRIFDLAVHYSAAGEHDQAVVFAVAAAEQAQHQHSLEIAEQQYRIAAQGTAHADAPVRHRIALGLGEVLMLRGRYDAARQMFEEARRLASAGGALGDPALVMARIECELGELAFKQGDMRSTTEAIERALRLLGRRTPKSRLMFLGVLLYQTLVQTLHVWWPRRFLARRSLRGAERELLIVRLFSRLGHAYWFERGAVATLATHLRGLNLIEQYPPTRQLAQTYSEHAPGMSLLAWFSRAFDYAQRSLTIRDQLGDTWGRAQSLHFQGIVFFAAARFEQCIASCREAIQLFDRTGDYWELNMARYQVAASLYRLGDLPQALAEALAMHRSGLELGDVQAAGLSVDILSKAACGRVPQDLVQTELSRPRGADVQTASQVLQAEGVRLMAEADYHGAAAAFQEAWRVAYARSVKNTYVAPSLPWLATALRREAAASHAPGSRDSRRLLRQAQAALRRGLRLARKFQNDLPHVLREQGLVAAACGRPAAARRFLQEALAVATLQGARYEAAQTKLALAELEQQLNPALDDEPIAAARAALAAFVNAPAPPAAGP